MLLNGLTRATERAKEGEDMLTAEFDHRVKNIRVRVAVAAMFTTSGQPVVYEFIQALDGASNRWRGPICS